MSRLSKKHLLEECCVGDRFPLESVKSGLRSVHLPASEHSGESWASIAPILDLFPSGGLSSAVIIPTKKKNLLLLIQNPCLLPVLMWLRVEKPHLCYRTESLIIWWSNLLPFFYGLFNVSETKHFSRFILYLIITSLFSHIFTWMN